MVIKKRTVLSIIQQDGMMSYVRMIVNGFVRETF